MADVDQRSLSATQSWRCDCGYANVGSLRCQMCGRVCTDAPTLSAALRMPGPLTAPPATAVRGRPAGAALYAPPALVLLVIAVVAGNAAYQHGVVALLDGRSRDVALLVMLLAGLLFYVLTWIVASTVARTVHVSPAFDRSFGRAILAGLSVGGAVAAIGAAVTLSAKGHAALDPTAAWLIDDGRWTALAVGVLVIVVAAPLAEEYVFRGLVAQAFAEHNRTVAIWVSSIGFAAAHLSPLRFPYYLVMGAIFCRVYLRRGLAASVTAHAVFNGAVLVVAAIAITGGTGKVEAAGLRLTLPSGWHEVSATAGDDLVAAGPNGSLLELMHLSIPPGAVADPNYAVRALATSPSFSGIQVQGSSARIRAIGAGAFAQAEITSDKDAGFVDMLVAKQRVFVLVIHAPNAVDLTTVVDRILASTVVTAG